MFLSLSLGMTILDYRFSTAEGLPARPKVIAASRFKFFHFLYRQIENNREVRQQRIANSE
jgi:hypothetical protein